MITRTVLAARCTATLASLLLVALLATLGCDAKSANAPPAGTSTGGAAITPSQPAVAAWQFPTPPDFSTAESLTQGCDREFARIEELRKSILAVTAPRTVANTLEPYNEIQIHLNRISSIASLLENTHPDPAYQESTRAISQRASTVGTELLLDTGLYQALGALAGLELDPAARRLVELSLRDYRRSGIELPQASRDRIKQISDELTLLSQEFQKNTGADQRSIQLASAKDLEGLPADYIAGHPPGADGKITITTNYPDFFPFMEFAKNGDARKRLQFEFLNRAAPKNIEILSKVLVLREEFAKLLGYERFSDYAAETMMIAKGAAIPKFIAEITALAKPVADANWALLLEEKRKDDPAATTVNAWEKDIYENRLKKRICNFDPQEMRPYFEFGRVKKGLLDIYAELLGLRFELRKGDPVWHESVESYDLYVVDGKERLAGRFYLDLHPRPGKYNHAACFSVQPGIRGREIPISALVCNFPDPSKGLALSSHDDVTTFFHEFGHLLHYILSGDTPWNRFSGSIEEWDFVEAPSQMLEEWVQDIGALERFAVHHETGEKLPRALVDKMLAADRFGRGLWCRHQMFYAALAYESHSRPAVGLDTTALLQEMQKKYSYFGYVPETHFHAAFGHLIGYSANYYTYMWSLVIAKDMASAFEKPDGKRNLMDKQIAARYRREILESGASRPAAESVEKFLGRPYSFDAFRRWLSEGLPGATTAPSSYK